jgi:hypothetical protein
MQSKYYETWPFGSYNTAPNRGAMTVDEFCSWASIGRSKFYQEVAEGRITIRKIGRKSVVTLTPPDFVFRFLKT